MAKPNPFFQTPETRALATGNDIIS